MIDNSFVKKFYKEETKMYPGTIFNWHDNSRIDTVTTSTTTDSAPSLMQISAIPFLSIPGSLGEYSYLAFCNDEIFMLTSPLYF